jgi:type II secretory pathway component PulF
VVDLSALNVVFLPSVTLVLLGVALRFSLRLLYGARGPSPDDAIHLLTRILSWGLIIVPGIALLAITINWLTLLLAAAILTAAAEAVFAKRSIQRRAAWELVLASRRGNRSLGESLQFHEARFTGIVGRAYRRLTAELQQGSPWTDAVWNNQEALPREAATYARLYQTAATPEAAADEASSGRDLAIQQLQQLLVQQASYLVTVTAMMTAVFIFVGIKIVPSYLDILADFSLPTPPITESLIQAFNLAESTGAAPIIGLSIIAGILAAGVVYVCYLCDWPVLQPLTDRFGIGRHQAYLLRLLALGVEQHMPISEVLGRLDSGRGAYWSGVVRRRIAAARRRIAEGAEWQAALKKSSLISAGDAATLRVAQQVGNLPWAMRLLADRKLALLASRWTMLFQLLFAAVILVLAAITCWYAVAMFVPIIDCIWTLL